MTKEILLSIRGLQIFVDDETQNNTIEIITPGDYYKKNEKHYVLYEEIMDDYQQVTKNVIKVTKDSVDITKKGDSDMHMVFEKNRKNLGYYHTKFGTLVLGVAARQVQVSETENDIDININYDLEIDNQFLSNFDISMNIKANDAKEFKL
jgi:uncharacterized beta-barrel protein YwiB (DUF1934 family)